MAKTVGDFVVERLSAWGVRRIYGYPGDGINGVMGALGRSDGGIAFVQARHEELAAFMACAHAKFTGEVGVCLATSGPGAIHLLNGLYDAKADHMPVVAIVGQQARAALGGHYQLDVNLAALFADVCAYVQQVSVPSQLRHVIDRAMRVAKAERKVACIILPNDIQELDAEQPAHAHGTIHSGVGFEAPRVVPEADTLRRAADALNAGKRVAMLVGAGALGAGQEVLAVADRLGAGIAKALLGKAVVPDALPFVTGSIGLLGSEPSSKMMEGCDTLLMVGSGFPYSEFLPKEGDARAVQIDRDPSMLSLRYPMEVNLCGDAAATLRALLPLLQQKPDTKWRERIAGWNESWWALLEKRAMAKADPVNPQRVFWELSTRLPDRTIIAGDSGSSTNWFARDVKLRDGMMASLSGGLASMGSGMPYAIAAKFAHPDRPVVAIVGDGAMQMNGINELITVAKYWKDWADHRMVILVLNNRDLNQVTWEQRVMEGDPKFLGSQSVPDFPYARYADMLGLKGLMVDDPELVGAAWDQAFAADRPVVLEARTDPNVPPLPPHITLANAKSFARSMAGEPELGSVLANTARQVLSRVLPGS